LFQDGLQAFARELARDDFEGPYLEGDDVVLCLDALAQRQVFEGALLPFDGYLAAIGDGELQGAPYIGKQGDGVL